MKSNVDRIAEAQRFKDVGQLAPAEAICRQLLGENPRDAGALHLLGAILHLRGRQEDAIKLLHQAVEADPTNAGYLVTLGGNLAIAGRMSEATECFRKAVIAKPNSVEAHYNLGLARKHSSEFVEAEKCFRETLALAPTYVDAIANLGFVVLSLNRSEEAKAIFAKALVISPTHPLSLTCLARILTQEGKHAEAEVLLRAFDPNASEASLFQLAQTYEHMSNNALAISALRHLAAKHPRSAEALAALATGLIGDFQITEGMEVAKKSIEIDATCVSAWCSLGMAYVHSGLYQEAHDALTRTINLKPVIGPRVMRDLMLPCIMGTREEVQKSRQVFEQNLDKLYSEDLVSTNPLGEIGFTYFYLAYHGENDIHIQKKISRLYRKIAPSLNFVAPHCDGKKPVTIRKRIRVGFYSHFVSAHSVSFSFSRILEALSALDEFEVYLVTDAALTAEGVAAMYPTLKGHAIQTARDLKSAQRLISDLEFDILIYLDIGMDPLAFLLAFSRLAPVQCVMGGHPVTTGISTIDYFFSADSVEAPGAQEHYSEKLILLTHGAFIFQRMEMPKIMKTRAELGMPSTKRIYLCPMTLQKIHPDFDEAVERILRLDQDGSVVFFESAQSPQWALLLKKRFDKTIDKSVRDRVVFMPWIRDQQELISVIAQSQVVLDPFHFGIGTTGIHVFTAGTPLVTRPSRYLRGRIGYLYCNLLETTECITADVDEYVAMAIRIAKDEMLRDKLKANILKYNYRIFENASAAPEFANALKQLAATHQ